MSVLMIVLRDTFCRVSMVHSRRALSFEHSIVHPCNEEISEVIGVAAGQLPVNFRENPACKLATSDTTFNQENCL